MSFRIFRHNPLLASVVAISFASATGWSQSCVYNFSESFQTYGSPTGTIYTSVSVYDNSNCNHSNYLTTVNISLGTGQWSSSPPGGLSATGSIDPSDPGPSDNGFISVDSSANGTFYCPAARGTLGFGGGQSITMPWADVFSLPNDGINMVFTQSDYNFLVSQNIIAVGAGTVILVSQPELYPIITTAIVIVALGYITYKVAKKIAQAVQNAQVHPVNIKQLCYDELYKCIEYPHQPNTGYGSTKDCSSCYRECVNAGGNWPYYKCQETSY